MTDAAFLASFEDGSLPNEAFRHRDHLRMTWLYLRRDGLEVGTRSIRDGIQRFAGAKGATMLYHETLTRVWIRLVAVVLAETGPETAFEALVAAHPELLDKRRPWLFYRTETLASTEAKTGWVEPDLSPLPAILRPWTTPIAAR